MDIGSQNAHLLGIVKRAEKLIGNDLVGEVSFEIFGQDEVCASITKNRLLICGFLLGSMMK
ncbi:MAG: hypothetical protein ABJQ63_03090 [Lentilitoribacter sp.]